MALESPLNELDPEKLEDKIEFEDKEYIVGVHDPHFPRIGESGYMIYPKDYGMIIGDLYIIELIKKDVPFWKKNLKNLGKPEHINEIGEATYIEGTRISFPNIEKLVEHINGVQESEGKSPIEHAEVLLSRIQEHYNI